ncbi:hypothetical protein OH76DRAFT_1480298 [Lentinus brumalis]|uniref:Uncharacterized protein n=1 Tax=Lentinus brumalis TaxID=2498619 RepID=A0A371DJG2_9APHY|nr:hypothetical protein OH76DRAFT_1480298 [Polyporus brumalis]
MSLNDTDVTLGGNRGVDLHPGVANPTISSTHADPMKANFVTDPTDETLGAGAAGNFTGHKEAARNFSQSAGVVEGRPGIIETANIDPLNENSNKDDGWANARSTSTGSGPALTERAGGVAQGAYNTATTVASSAADMVSGAAQTAYKYVAGDEKSRQAGKESSA